MATRSSPYPALLAVALVPALALGGCWQFAASRVSDGQGIAAPTTSIDPARPAQLVTPLVTPLLSVRRTPGVLARSVNLGAFSAGAAQFAATLGDTSCVAISVDGRAVVSAGADRVLRPASNVKLLVAAVALEVLGPDYTYTTAVRGALSGATVVGDLHLVGGGDPVLNSTWWNGPNTRYPPFNSTSIEGFADAIVAAGVGEITGSIVGDDSRYDDEWYPPTWSSAVRFGEGGPVSALLANDSRESRDRASNDPAVGAAAVLTAELRARGVVVAGEARRGVAPDGVPVIASVSSLPMSALLAEMLTTSDNTAAEMIVKELGVARSGIGSREAGLEVVRSTIASWGVPVEGLVLVDGSGLSDDNRASCATMIGVLQHLAPDDPVASGLAVAGAPGGTLAEAFADTPMLGLLRAKTGTLSNADDGPGGRPAVKALSGFVPLEGGGAIEFSLLLNGPTIAERGEYGPIWSALAALFGTYVAGPSAADLGPR